MAVPISLMTSHPGTMASAHSAKLRYTPPTDAIIPTLFNPYYFESIEASFVRRIGDYSRSQLAMPILSRAEGRLYESPPVVSLLGFR